MKKLEHRALLCLVLAGFLLAGLVLFTVLWTVRGGSWASAAFNRHLYNSQGILMSGTVLDRNGEVLTTVDEDGNRVYAGDKVRRTATLHAVGDLYGNISTGALSAFAQKLTGYNPIFGAFGAEQGGNNLYLTVDAGLNEVAYQALGGKKGTVAVYNYKTGEILCMVSAPAYDPMNIPTDLEENENYEGAYLNRFLSSAFTPGSVFKTVTLTAALEELPDLEGRTWTCTGSTQIGDGTVTCASAHGEQDIRDALANSCNGVFGQMAVELGGDTLERYAEKAGLTSSYSINGISTARGSFSFAGASETDLAWGGVGQYHDSVNPCALMIYMGAIANGGKAAVPRLIQKVESQGLPSLPQFTRRTHTLISSDTAETVAEMMMNNVQTAYGTKRFPNMELGAKSGTAEVGGERRPHAWFTGFLKNEDAPYAFVVLVENGGSGADVAGTVASKVLRAALERGD